MRRDYVDSARAAVVAEGIASVAGQNLKQVLRSLKNCLQVVHMTQQMLEVDPVCICANSNGGELKWERRRELAKAATSIEIDIKVALRKSPLVELGLDAESDDKLDVQPKRGDDNNLDSARAAAEADRIASVAEQNLQQVLLSLKICLQLVHMTQQMLEVDPECICVNSNGGESKWERRRELDKAADCIETGIEVALRNNALVELGLDAKSDDRLVVQPKHGDDNNLLWCDWVCVYEKVDMDSAVWCTTPPTIMELVFARLPLDQLFQMRCLSKHWRDSIMSPSFQHAFGTTTSRRSPFLHSLEGVNFLLKVYMFHPR